MSTWLFLFEKNHPWSWNLHAHAGLGGWFLQPLQEWAQSWYRCSFRKIKKGICWSMPLSCKMQDWYCFWLTATSIGVSTRFWYMRCWFCRNNLLAIVFVWCLQWQGKKKIELLMKHTFYFFPPLMVLYCWFPSFTTTKGAPNGQYCMALSLWADNGYYPRQTSKRYRSLSGTGTTSICREVKSTAAQTFVMMRGWSWQFWLLMQRLHCWL